ncbi:hypothetical protein BKA64DRAFT_711649 [Cadophora sp. MPI-SDFR-AT-0126]|nr:hypothetical protein BKA64DRAFT_711649 [Leotiomycetes sp. MPI-SDFR-AT-0126]
MRISAAGLVFPILLLYVVISAAPYRPRSQHIHKEAHPIIQDHRHDLGNDTASIVILPVGPETYQQKADNDRDIGEVEVRTPQNLTPHVIVVQRMVDRVKSRIADKISDGNDDKNGKKQKLGDKLDVDNQGAESQLARDQDRSNHHLAEQETHADYSQDEMRGETGIVQQMKDNSTAEDPMERRREEGTRGENERGQQTERRHTSGPEPHDEGTEGMAILMGWTALLGVVGILAIAPAG